VLRTRTESDIDSDRLVAALGNPRASRLLLEATGPMTVPELSDACDVALSTTYRTVDRLCQANLLSESIDVDPCGRHVARYERTFDTVEVELLDEGIAITVVS
jgi:hypothetical protein